jgi:hypothetical protein
MAWVAAIPVAAWAVIRLFGLDDDYPLEAMMPFTPYVAAGAVALPPSGCAAAPRGAGRDLPPGRSPAVGVRRRHCGRRPPDAERARLQRSPRSRRPMALVHLVDELHPSVPTIDEYTPPRFVN